MKMDETVFLEKEIRRLSRQLDDRESIETLVLRRVDDALKNFKWTPPKRKAPDRRKLHSETCVIHISDTQIGKLTSTFDSNIAKQRMKKLAAQTQKIVDTRRSGAKIDKAVIMIGGDVVEGETIFAHQPWVVDSDLWDQAIKVAPKILSDFIIEMSGHFRDLTVTAVPGNHGRSQPKNAGASPRTNFDMIATVVTRLMVTSAIKDKRITWDVDHDSFYRIVNVEGHNLLLVHGDQISGGGGLGGYPLTGLARKVAGWSGSLPEDWKYIFLGHFHRPMSGVIQDKVFFANGTIESDNDFALEVIGESGRPCQRVVFFNKKHGPVADSLVWLD
jgi:hypothetical protein|tara:strand:- start:1139 stop:2131 length:993 start_codon:yes stop_codon:yes gene_type:complete